MMKGVNEQLWLGLGSKVLRLQFGWEFHHTMMKGVNEQTMVMIRV
jgi:hypothetical protein